MVCLLVCIFACLSFSCLFVYLSGNLFFCFILVCILTDGLYSCLYNFMIFCLSISLLSFFWLSFGPDGFSSCMFSCLYNFMVVFVWQFFCFSASLLPVVRLMVCLVICKIVFCLFFCLPICLLFYFSFVHFLSLMVCLLGLFVFLYVIKPFLQLS